MSSNLFPAFTSFPETSPRPVERPWGWYVNKLTLGPLGAVVTPRAQVLAPDLLVRDPAVAVKVSRLMRRSDYWSDTRSTFTVWAMAATCAALFTVFLSGLYPPLALRPKWAVLGVALLVCAVGLWVSVLVRRRMARRLHDQARASLPAEYASAPMEEWARGVADPFGALPTLIYLNDMYNAAASEPFGYALTAHEEAWERLGQSPYGLSRDRV